MAVGWDELVSEDFLSHSLKSQVQTPEKSVRTIDIHTHPLMIEAGCDRAGADAFMTIARQFGIVHIVALGDVLAYGRFPSESQVSKVNDGTAWLIKRFGNFVSGFCYLNPVLGARVVQRELERCLALGFKGVKLEIANNARDACMKPVMTLAARYDLPVLQHTWSMTKIRQRRYHSDPVDTVSLARRHPSVRVIMAHLTGCGIRGVLEAKGVDNLWVDTSGGAPEAGLVAHAVEQLGADRVLYGSDAPVRDFAVALARVKDAGLARSELSKVLHDNARHLLRLP